MTILLDAAGLDARRVASAGPLHPLADSLARDLEPVLARELFVPEEKARLTRRGGRCEFDGTMLEFDPFSPRSHRCPRCGRTFDDETHYRWWVMGYQLWLAERAVHSATVFAMRREARHLTLASSILAAYADRYLEYPNQDNVLGPTRVFFSTYLESIWLLQLIIALDLLEMTSPSLGSLPSIVRDRIVEPSAALIVSYDEGLSNRQVWNNAALLAASRSLGQAPSETALRGPSGLVTHLTSGLLADGTWYEGENYHLFAHRGLWYGVAIAEAAGVSLDARLISRFDEAFATPFVSALPDFTFPSRRDSQYAVSLRQWRFAELAELGLVRQPSDDRLIGALATLYDDAVPHHDTGRPRSTAEAERNTPATSLDRSDLGWRSLLFALPSLPTLSARAPRSALLASQGYAILRRDGGRLYSALDYGHSGAGHGHPDRLNFVLVHGARRWLDDMGTGSYVDPSLHWYRSTLAHNAPLVDRRSQQRVHGSLVAFDERQDRGWVRARVDGVAPGVRLERSVVAMPSYVIDELTWHADREVDIDLPLHVDGELTGIGPWRPADPAGGADTEDGFRFLVDPETAESSGGVRLHGRLGAATADAHVFVSTPHAWWRAVALGAPGSGPTRFHFVRARGRSGRIVSVWDVLGVVQSATAAGASVRVSLADGTIHHHESRSHEWMVDGVTLAGFVPETPSTAERAPVSPRRVVVTRHATPDGRASRAQTFELGEAQYHRSEPSWAEAGAPTATVSISAVGDELVIVTDVRKRDLHFAAARDENTLDNEHPDTNSDGIQLHVMIPDRIPGSSSTREITWLMVPEPETARVRVTTRAVGGAPPEMVASWWRTSTGYSVRAAIALGELATGNGASIRLGVVVNDMSPGRERRRGQLVLGGAPGEFIYLRGDRIPREAYVELAIVDA